MKAIFYIRTINGLCEKPAKVQWILDKPHFWMKRATYTTFRLKEVVFAHYACTAAF